MPSSLPTPGGLLALVTLHRHHEVLGALCGLLVGVAGIVAAVWFKMRVFERDGAFRQDATPHRDRDKLSW